MSTISVVIPVRNGEKTIEKAILSVINQKYDPIELIILDGGSTDGTLDIIKKYQSQIFYWHSQADGSSGLAINIGIQKATGDWIVQLMADDWFEPGIFHAVAHEAMNDLSVDVISCGGRVLSYDENLKKYEVKTSYTTKKQLDITTYNMCFGLPVTSSRFIKKQFIKKLGLLIPFNSQGLHNFSADREFMLRASIIGCKNKVIDYLGHTYFSHPASATFAKNRANQLRIYQEHMEFAQHYLSTYPLTRKQRYIIHYWYNDQSMRLFIFKLFNGEFGSCLKIAKDGIRLSGFGWIAALLLTPCSIILNKIYRCITAVLRGKQYAHE